jgi:capsular exopolysaccharide synthesis family protein
MNDQSLSLGGPEGHNRLVPAVPQTGPALLREYTEDPQSDLVDLRDIWAAVWRNRYLITIIMMLAIAAGLASIKLMQPVYRGTATLEIDPNPVKVLGTEDTEPMMGSTETDRFMQTQVDILHSRALAARVTDNLNLAVNDQFLNRMRVEFDVSARRSAAIGTLMANVVADVPKASRILPVSFDSPDPATAARVANGYAENFIAANLQRRFDTSTYSKNFLQSQLTVTKAKLEESERNLLAYARAAGIVDPNAGAGDTSTTGGDASNSLTTSNLVQLNAAYAAARSARIQAEQKWREAQSTPLMSVPDVITNNAIGALTQKRAELEAAYQEQLQHRKPDHPAVQQAAAVLQTINAQINALANTVRESIRNQYETSAKQEAALAGTVGELKGATLSEQSRGIRYNILKREVDTNRQLYDGLLQRFKEVSAQAGVTANNISIIDPAELPGAPISPNPIINLALATIAGLVLAFLLVLLREIFDDSVRNPEDVERRFGLHLLGAVPKIKGSTLQALSDQRSSITEAYSAVRASVDLSGDEGPPAAVLITSSQKGEGKSTTALAIARDAATAGRKVLLIDADMRSPSLHVLLGTPQGPGLAEILSDKLLIHQAIMTTHHVRLDLLPAGQPATSPAQLLSGIRFTALLAEAKGRYDEVIIDSPPVLGLADTPQLAAATDRTIMVVGSDRAHRAAVKEALRRLSAARADILGAILVKFVPEGPWGKGYYSYYSYDDWSAEQAPRLPGSVADGPLGEPAAWPKRLWRRLMGSSPALAS